MKKAFCVILLALIAWDAFPQKKRFLELGVGFTGHVIKDDAMSPVRYTGVLPTLSPRLLIMKSSKKLIELGFPLQYSNIHARQFKKYPSMKGQYFRFDIDYINMRKTNLISDSSRGSVYIGGALQSMIAVRFMPQLDNSAIIYDYLNSLGVAAAYKRSFRFRDKTLIQYHRVTVPILSLATRPDYMNLYNVIEPGGNDPVSDAFSRAKLRSLGSVQRVVIRNSLFYPIRSGNMLGITYEWQYYSASFRVPVQAASHSIMLSLLVNI
jgi:hypothetical protein